MSHVPIAVAHPHVVHGTDCGGGARELKACPSLAYRDHGQELGRRILLVRGRCNECWMVSYATPSPWLLFTLTKFLLGQREGLLPLVPLVGLRKEYRHVLADVTEERGCG